MGRVNSSTEGGKDPYYRKGFYWIVFGHMYAGASPKFKRRMTRLEKKDEKYKKSISANYPNVRKS